MDAAPTRAKSAPVAASTSRETPKLESGTASAKNLNGNRARTMTNFSDRWRPMVQAINLPFLDFFFARERKNKAHTPDTLERTLYDPNWRGNSQAKGRSKLLNIDELIPIEDDPASDDEATSRPIARCVLRFNTDWKAKTADIVMLVSVLISGFTAPLTFIWDAQGWTPSKVPGGNTLLSIDLFVDVVYAGHLILQLYMSVHHPTQRCEIVNPRKIRHFRLTSPLYWLRWITTLPYFPIAAFDARMVLNNVKALRITHLMTMPDSLWRVQDKGWVTLLRPFSLLLCASHWVACLLYCYGGYREHFEEKGEAAFESSFYGQKVSGVYSLYLMAFVEALYMLTGALDNPVGDGSVREGQFGSLVLVSIFGPVGCIIIALFISSVVREQSMAFALEMRHEENKAFITRALQILDIPDALQHRVLSMHYYQRLGHDQEAFNELFDKKTLSPPLENALLVYLYRDTVVNSDLLKQKDSNYIVEVLRALQFQVYLPGDYIARRGEVSSVMFFVNKGTLSVWVPHAVAKTRFSRAKCVVQLEKGKHFGEVALLKETTRTAWVRADTYALVSALHRDDVEKIWVHFPDERDELQRMVQATLKKDRVMFVKQRWKKAFVKVRRRRERGHNGQHGATWEDDGENQDTEAKCCTDEEQNVEEATDTNNDDGGVSNLSPDGFNSHHGHHPGGAGNGGSGGGYFRVIAAHEQRVMAGFARLQAQMEELIDRQRSLEELVSHERGTRPRRPSTGKDPKNAPKAGLTPALGSDRKQNELPGTASAQPSPRHQDKDGGASSTRPSRARDARVHSDETGQRSLRRHGLQEDLPKKARKNQRESGSTPKERDNRAEKPAAEFQPRVRTWQFRKQQAAPAPGGAEAPREAGKGMHRTPAAEESEQRKMVPPHWGGLSSQDTSMTRAEDEEASDNG